MSVADLLQVWLDVSSHPGEAKSRAERSAAASDVEHFARLIDTLHG
jgi:hypothetical protein